MRIGDEEKAQWDPRVCVTFQEKAWADRKWCMEWAATELKSIVDRFVDKHRRGLAIYDNLDGQSTVEYRALSKKIRADTHFGLPGATHLWQVIDDGIGIMIKNEMTEQLDKKLADDEEFYQEWTSGALPAWKVRVLVTFLAGEAWDEVQKRLDALQIFKNKGWAFTVSETNDSCKIKGLPSYEWSVDDDTSSSSDEDEDSNIDVDAEEMVEAGDDSEVEKEEESNTNSDDSDSSSEEEEIDPGPWEDTTEWQHLKTARAVKRSDMIAHKFMTRTGWEVGRVRKKANGRWDVKYPSETDLYPHDLKLSDYGANKYWVLVRKQH